MLIKTTLTRTMYQNYNRRLANKHRFSCAKEKSQIPSHIEISKVFDVIVVKFNLKFRKAAAACTVKMNMISY